MNLDITFNLIFIGIIFPSLHFLTGIEVALESYFLFAAAAPLFMLYEHNKIFGG